MKDLEWLLCTVYFDNFFNSPKLVEKLFQKRIYGIRTVWANRKQMPKMIDNKQMKRGDCQFLFLGNTMAGKWWIIGQCCFYHLPLKEWMTYYQFRGEKRVQRPNLWFLVVRLSSFTIAAWVELILWTSVLLHIVWIESGLLDFTSAFSLIWWLSHVSIVTSFITWSILTNCLSFIRSLLLQKT